MFQFRAENLLFSDAGTNCYAASTWLPILSSPLLPSAILFAHLAFLLSFLLLLPLLFFNLVKGLSVLLMFSKNQLLVLLIYCFSVFYFIYFLCAPYYFLSSGLKGFILLLFFQLLKVEDEVIDLRSFCFSDTDICGYKFLSPACSAASHYFCYITVLCSFISIYFLISLVMSSLTPWLFSRLLFHFHILANFPNFLLLLICHFIPW